MVYTVQMYDISQGHAEKIICFEKILKFTYLHNTPKKLLDSNLDSSTSVNWVTQRRFLCLLPVCRLGCSFKYFLFKC